MSLNALARFETGKVDPRVSTVTAIERALVKAGVEFLGRRAGGRGGAAAQPPGVTSRVAPVPPPRKHRPASRRRGLTLSCGPRSGGGRSGSYHRLFAAELGAGQRVPRSAQE